MDGQSNDSGAAVARPPIALRNYGVRSRRTEWRLSARIAADELAGSAATPRHRGPLASTARQPTAWWSQLLRPTVRMDPHIPSHSIEPPDLCPFHVQARNPPLIPAPGLRKFDQRRVFAKAPGERTLQSE